MIETVFLKRAIACGKRMRNEHNCDMVVIETKDYTAISEKYRVLTFDSFLYQNIPNKYVVCLFIKNKE